jgi:hypothetical protein
MQALIESKYCYLSTRVNRTLTNCVPWHFRANFLKLGFSMTCNTNVIRSEILGIYFIPESINSSVAFNTAHQLSGKLGCSSSAVPQQSSAPSSPTTKASVRLHPLSPPASAIACKPNCQHMVNVTGVGRAGIRGFRF